MTKSLRKRYAPRFESLEPKQMLAGDVVIDVVHGNLLIHGDELDNQIAITSGEVPGSYVIRGLNGTVVREAGSGEDAGDPSQQENAERPETVVVVEGVRRGVHVVMGEGDDTVALNDARFNGNVNISTGAGEDIVFIGAPDTDPTMPAGEENPDDPTTRDHLSVAMRRSLRISTGAGADRVVVDDARIRGSLSVATGVGADHVRIGDPLPPIDPPSTSGIVDSEQAGEDAAPSRSVVVGRAVNIALGQGEDSLVASNVATGRLHVAGGRGEAADDIALHHVRARNAFVHVGQGDDRVAIVDFAFGRLGVTLGAGADTLALSGTKARVAWLHGGLGDEDHFADLGDNMVRRMRVTGFELPETTDEDTPLVV